MSNPAETLALPCHACGARLAVAPGVSQVRCAHCGGVTDVPAEMRRRLEAHTARVAEAQRAAETDAHAAAMHAHAARTNLAAVVATLVFACSVPAWIIMVGSGATGSFGPLGWAAALAITLVPLGVIVHAIVGTALRRGAALARAREAARCATCGGPLELAEGRGMTRCAWCGAHAIAAPAHLEALERAARERGARARRHAAEAEAQNHRSLEGFNAGLAWLADGPLGFAPFFAVAVLVAGVILFVATAFSPEAGMRGVGLFGLAVCGGLAALALVWGAIDALQRALWARLVAAARPGWRARVELLRDAAGALPVAAVVAAAAGAAAGGALMLRGDDDDAGWILVGIGIAAGVFALGIAAVRVAWAVLVQLVRWARGRW